TEPVREFHPPVTGVTVQAIYDSDNIALLVRWHDRTAEKTGKAGPALVVPPEEEETESGPAGAQPTETNPFGDVAQPPAQNAPTDPFAEAAAPAAAVSEFADAVAVQVPS